MDDAGQMGYPAIAKGQRLSAERLEARVDVPQPSEQRPVAQFQIRERNEQGERQHIKPCRQRDANSSKIITTTGGVRMSPPRHVPPSHPAVYRDLSDRSRSISPLPPRHGDDPGCSSSSSVERVFADMRQVKCGIL